MEKQKKLYLRILIISQIVISILIFTIILVALNDVSNYNNNILNMLSVSETKQYMKESVNNCIIRIDTKRDKAYKQVNDIINISKKQLLITDENGFLKMVKLTYSEISKNEFGQAIKIELKDLDTGENIIISEKESKEYSDKKILYNEIKKGKYLLKIYARHTYIDEIVKKQVYEEIHNSYYENNEYIWVNEILDYEGGDNYAIRRIHPNIVASEGKVLSTNTKDINGNYPYLKELEGIKQNGEIIQTYYFKNKKDNNITEKMSYAKLYKPFNWIIATGKPLNDIFSYTDQMKTYNKNKMIEILLVIGISIVIMCSSVLWIIVKVQKKYIEFIDNYIKIETETDLLTGALSRRYAECFFKNKLYQNYEGVPPLFIMLDIDDFKNINDNYGHDAGDMVLKRITKSIQVCIGEKDKLFRWGGEEFLIVCYDIDKYYEISFTEKILSTVNAMVFEVENMKFKTSVSMGGAYMLEELDYTEVIKLADEALYKAKHTGKNRYCNNSKERRV